MNVAKQADCNRCCCDLKANKMDSASSSDSERDHKKSKKEKKEKKEKKDKKDKKDKKSEKRSRDEVEQPASKKRKMSEDFGDNGKKRQAVSEYDINDASTFPRRARTRSMSEVEEVNRIDTNQTAEEFRKTHQITITGTPEGGSGTYVCPDPMSTFASTPFAPPLRKALDAAGFPNPTPTQAQSWPIALAGRDIITVAKTGSGKTCGFLLPAFHLLLGAFAAGRKRGPPAILVLAPTRELACQIEEEAIKFGRTSNIRSVCAYGGAPKSLQIRKIQAGVEVLICTPGRLNDLLEMGVVNLSQVLFLVLDEADRMYVVSSTPLPRTNAFADDSSLLRFLGWIWVSSRRLEPSSRSCPSNASRCSSPRRGLERCRSSRESS